MFWNIIAMKNKKQIEKCFSILFLHTFLLCIYDIKVYWQEVGYGLTRFEEDPVKTHKRRKPVKDDPTIPQIASSDYLMRFYVCMYIKVDGQNKSLSLSFFLSSKISHIIMRRWKYNLITCHEYGTAMVHNKVVECQLIDSYW